MQQGSSDMATKGGVGYMSAESIRRSDILAARTKRYWDMSNAVQRGVTTKRFQTVGDILEGCVSLLSYEDTPPKLQNRTASLMDRVVKSKRPKRPKKTDRKVIPFPHAISQVATYREALQHV